jgi:hypothetical protein
MDNPPNANIHTIVKAQIVFLLSTLTEDNFDRNQIEIRSVSVNWALGYIEYEHTDMECWVCVCPVVRTTWAGHLPPLHPTTHRSLTSAVVHGSGSFGI